MKSHDSFGDVSKGGGDRGGGQEDDRESGSEETIVEHTSSQATVNTNSTITSQTGQTSQTSMLTGDITENTIVRTKSYSTSNIAVSTSNNSITIEAPILEETLPTTDPMLTLLNPFQCTENQRPSIKAEPQSGSYKDLRHSPVLRKESQLRVPPSISSRRGKAGPSVQSSHVTALPGSSRSHHRQASMGIFHHNPSPLSFGHKRHSSFR